MSTIQNEKQSFSFLLSITSILFIAFYYFCTTYQYLLSMPMRIFIAISLMAALWSMSCAVSAQTPQSLVVSETTLSNGMKVWLNEDHSQPKVFGAVVVNAGAKDCPNTGIAHYFEHIMFKGTDCIGTIDYKAEKVWLDSISDAYDRLAAADDDMHREVIQKEINRLSVKASDYTIPNEFNSLVSRYGGSNLNAGTSYDFTFYHNSFTPQYLEQWCMLNSQRFINPVFRMFQTELETVYEEKNREADDPMGAIRQVIMKELFGTQPYAYPVLGSTENLKRPRLSEMKDFYEKYYVGCNMGIILCGDFSADQVLPLLERTFARIPRGKLPERGISPLPAITKERTVEVKLPIPLISVEMLAFKAPTEFDEDDNAMDMVASLLSNGQAGMLDSLVNEGELMAAGFSTVTLNDAAVAMMYVMPNLLAKTKKAENSCKRQLQQLLQGQFSDDVFNTQKQKLYRDAMRGLESIDGKSMKMVELMASGHKWQEYVDKVNAIRHLTREDVVHVAKKYLNLPFVRFKKKKGSYDKDRMTQPGYMPVVPRNNGAESQFATVLAQVPVAETPPRLIDFNRDVTVTPLDANTTLYHKNNDVNDMFELVFNYNIGMKANSRLGMATAMMNLCGTDSLKKQQLETRLQSLGASIDFSSEPKSTSITVKGIDRNFGATMQLLYHLLTHVKADEDIMKKVIGNVRAEESSLGQDQDGVFNALLLRLILGEQSPMLNRITYDEAKTLSSAELLSIFNIIFYSPCSVTYTGTLTNERVARVVRQFIPESQAALPYNAYDYDIKTYDEQIVYVVDMDESRQNQIISYYQIAPQPTQEGRAMAQLLKSYIGGSMSSVLFQEVREFRSMAYLTGSVLWTNSIKTQPQSPLALVSYVGTQADKSMQVIALMDSLMNDLPVRDNSFITARQECINDIYNNYPTFRHLPQEVAHLRQLGYEKDSNDGLFDIYKRATINDMKTFYEKYVKCNAGRRVIAIMGDKKSLNMKELRKYGKVIVLKMKDLINK